MSTFTSFGDIWTEIWPKYLEAVILITNIFQLHYHFSVYILSGSAYKKMEYGTFCSGSWARITSEEICKEAASTLNLIWGQSWDGPEQFPGCFHSKDPRNMVYFNTSPNPSKIPNNNDYAEICETGIISAVLSCCLLIGQSNCLASYTVGGILLLFCCCLLL